MRPLRRRFALPFPLSRRILPAVLLSGGLAAPWVQAHRVSSVSLISYLDTEGRTYALDAAMEVVPSEDPAVNDQISPEDAAREFAGYLNVMFDKARQRPDMEISVEETSDSETPEELRRRQVLTKLKGRIPDGAKEFLLYLDPRCPMAVVMVVVKDEQPSRRMQVILAGEYSRPVSVVPVEGGDPFQASPPASIAVAESGPAPGHGAAKAPGAFRSGWSAFFHESALPSALFVALLLLTLGRRSVSWQVGVSLATQGVAASLGVWRFVPVPEWADAALAALVAIVAIEALFHQRVKAWRYPLAGLAGAASGLHLAGAGSSRELLSEGDLGAGRAIGFLLGVESAAVLLALAAAAVLLSLGRFDWYRKSVVTPVVVLVAGYALFTVASRWM